MRHSALKTFTRPVAAFAAIMMLAAIGSRAHAQVIPGDTFDIDVAGFNGTGSGAAGAFLTNQVDPVFGMTQTFTGAALGGQTLTVTSSEVVGATTTTDTITISVPTNFAPTGTTISGGAVEEMQANLGAFNTGTDTLDYQAPLDPATVYGGSLTYIGGTLPLTPGDTLTNGNMSLSMVEGVNAGGSSLSPFNVNSFTFTVTYPNVAVPEPSSLALLGVVGLVPMARRWRKKTVVA